MFSLPQAKADESLEPSNEPVAGADQLVVGLNGGLLCEPAHSVLYEDDGDGPYPQEHEPNQQERQST